MKLGSIATLPLRGEPGSGRFESNASVSVYEPGRRNQARAFERAGIA